jgi:hypothetical protein
MTGTPPARPKSKSETLEDDFASLLQGRAD